MKVLSVGRDKVERIKKCSSCKSVLLYGVEDLTMKENGSMSLYLSCPICTKVLKASRFDKIYKPERDGVIIEKREIGFKDI